MSQLVATVPPRGEAPEEGLTELTFAKEVRQSENGWVLQHAKNRVFPSSGTLRLGAGLFS